MRAGREASSARRLHTETARRPAQRLMQHAFIQFTVQLQAADDEAEFELLATAVARTNLHGFNL